MKKIIVTAFVSFLFIAGIQSNAQVYMVIEGVEGEVNVKGLRNAFEVQSISMGATNSATMSTSTGGAGAGKVSVSDISFTKQRGSSSAGIQKFVFNGKVIPKVEIWFNKSGSTTYLKITLENVLISSWQLSGDGQAAPMESMSLNYGKIKTEDIVQNPDGTTRTIPAGWDILKNIAF
jgi:type VI secretion system secreted protein Hcp